MTDPYLILHKVRGEPAFDIAAKIMIGDKQGWIIPTSGHRAYPTWWYRLDHLTHVKEPDMQDVVDLAMHIGIPDDWPDHYDAKRDETSIINSARDALIRRGRISAAKSPKPAYRRC